MTNAHRLQALRQYGSMVFCLAMLVGMVVSKVVLSIGMIGLCVNAVFDRQLPMHLRRLWASPALLAVGSVFVLFAISALFSHNVAFSIDRLRMKLPFLLLPLGLVGVPRLGRRTYMALLACFVALVTAISLYLLADYLLHFEALTQAYKEGKVMRTPGMHIHFSMMAAVAVAVVWAALWGRHTFRWPVWERRVQYGVLVFLLVFLHVLAVRSGLLMCYVAVAYFVGAYIVRRRQYALAGLLVLGLAGGLWLAYRYVPSLRNKVDYTLYNIYMVRHGEGLRELSDSYRVAGIEAGLAIGRRHLWTGVGIGDLRDATEAYLTTHYPDLVGPAYMPQSQYVLVFAALGLPGLLLFLVAVCWPFVQYRGRCAFLDALGLMMLSALAYEQVLETQVGTAIFIVFLTLTLRYFLEHPTYRAGH